MIFVKTEGYKKFKFDFETLFDPIVALYTRAKEGRHATQHHSQDRVVAAA